jgi:hypothetical protein
VNDSSWRSLSAILGVACVILIIAAGALLATSGGSPAPSSSDVGQTGATPSGSVATESSGPSAPASASSVPSVPSATPTPTAMPKAPIALATFSNLMLDAANDASGTARTFTFITDGAGPVGIGFTQGTGKALVKICAKIDDSKPDCRTGSKVTFTGALTDTAHSVWIVTLVGAGANTPTVSVSLSWPTNTPRITLTHGRLQGSTSPGVPEALNGFICTFKSRAAGNVTVAASWTTITTDIAMSTANVIGTTVNTVDEKQFKAAKNLGTPGYTFGVDGGKYYRVSLRDTAADSQRPDLTAVISFP